MVLALEHVQTRAGAGVVALDLLRIRCRGLAIRGWYDGLPMFCFFVPALRATGGVLGPELDCRSFGLQRFKARVAVRALLSVSCSLCVLFVEPASGWAAGELIELIATGGDQG